MTDAPAQTRQHHASPRVGSDARRLVVLGSTGSVGTQTLEVIRHLNALHASGAWPTAFEVVGLAAGARGGDLLAQARAFGVDRLALRDETDLGVPRGVTLRVGPDAAEQLVRDTEPDVVLGAIVGVAGLRAVLAAAELGIDVALANKEPLVAAGPLVTSAARASGARLLPVDSEHSAAWQCLSSLSGPGFCPPAAASPAVKRLVLTASGGPFRDRTAEDVYHAPPAEALAHPNWSMGDKITIDSATLVNKALELIEARWLFDLPASKLDAVIHPPSTVHAIVETVDGATLAHLGVADMRIAVQHALTFPGHAPSCAGTLDLLGAGPLEFFGADEARWPALSCAKRVIERGGTGGAVLNAANEAAVHAYLAGRIPFGRIVELACASIGAVGIGDLRTLEDVSAADAEARRFVRAEIEGSG